MKKKVAFALCTALMLGSMSVAALAAEPMTDADTVSTMISAADTLPGVSAYPAEVRASEENGVYRLEKVYYLTAKDDPTTIPTADFEREGHTYTLLDLLKNDQTETDTREHIEVVTLESKTKDMAEILKILGWGIVQVGMSIQSHDASQRTQGFLCLFGGLMIAFAKEILTAIGAI